jgi:hypothetical protein
VHENLNLKSKKQEVDIPEAEIPEEVLEEKIPEASQVKGQEKEKEDLVAVLLRHKTWKELSLPERRAIGKVGAEKREAYELKLATPSRLYYRLFEECCVHGMMNGEASALQNTMLDKGQMLLQVFNLMI